MDFLALLKQPGHWDDHQRLIKSRFHIVTSGKPTGNTMEISWEYHGNMMGILWGYPLVVTNSLLLKMAQSK